MSVVSWLLGVMHVAIYYALNLFSQNLQTYTHGEAHNLLALLTLSALRRSMRQLRGRPLAFMPSLTYGLRSGDRQEFLSLV